MPPNLALAACSAVSKCGCYQEGRWLASLWQSKSMKLFFSRARAVGWSQWRTLIDQITAFRTIYDPSQYELYNSGIQSIELNLGNAAWPSLQIKLLSIVVSFSLVFFFFFFHLLFFSIFFFIGLFPCFSVFCSPCQPFDWNLGIVSSCQAQRIQSSKGFRWWTSRGFDWQGQGELNQPWLQRRFYDRMMHTTKSRSATKCILSLTVICRHLQQ